MFHNVISNKRKKRNNLGAIKITIFLCFCSAVITFGNLFFSDYSSSLTKYYDYSAAPIMTTLEKGTNKTLDNSNSIKNRNDYNGVVIVTKVLSGNDAKNLGHWICFINHAFNDKKKYDFVVFTTMPFNDDAVVKLQKAAEPAKLSVVIEGPPLEERLARMTEEERRFLYSRCNHENKTLNWYTRCTEPDMGENNIGYMWQAEFRAYHIWKNSALKDYKYMMWFDADAYVGKTWDIDPIKVMVEQNLTIMYACFPYGNTRRDEGLAKKLKSAYNFSICGVFQSEDKKYIYPKICQDDYARFKQIGGNHHITNLDVFRSDIHQRFLKSFVGDYKFNRRADDQKAVTIIGVVEEYLRNHDGSNTNGTISPRTYHEKSNGMDLKIAHHRMFDCTNSKPKPATNNPWKFFNDHVKTWPGLKERCGAYF